MAEETVEVAAPSPFYLVWNPSNRSPSRKQPSLSVATAEAERLARENPGTFYVLAVVGSARMTTLESASFPFDREAELSREPVARPLFDPELNDDVPF